MIGKREGEQLINNKLNNKLNNNSTELNNPNNNLNCDQNCDQSCNQNNDLISRQVAIDALKEMTENTLGQFRGQLLHWTGVKAMLEDLPAVQPDIEEQLKAAYAHGYTDAEADLRKQRKRGSWIYSSAGDCMRCSECGSEQNYIAVNFCPNCGACMGGEQE